MIAWEGNNGGRDISGTGEALLLRGGDHLMEVRRGDWPGEVGAGGGGCALYQPNRRPDLLHSRAVGHICSAENHDGEQAGKDHVVGAGKRMTPVGFQCG